MPRGFPHRSGNLRRSRARDFHLNPIFDCLRAQSSLNCFHLAPVLDLDDPPQKSWALQSKARSFTGCSSRCWCGGVFPGKKTFKSGNAQIFFLHKWYLRGQVVRESRIKARKWGESIWVHPEVRSEAAAPNGRELWGVESTLSGTITNRGHFVEMFW